MSIDDHDLDTREPDSLDVPQLGEPNDVASASTDDVHVAIVNDFELVVAGLNEMLRPFDDLRVVEASVNHTPQQQADVTLFDSYGHFGTGPERIAALAADAESGNVAVFTFHLTPTAVDEALHAGATSVLSKGLSASQLAEALRRTARGERLVLAQSGRLADTARWPGREVGLTERESEVLALMASGLSNRELAVRLGISEHTVKVHLKHVYAKLGFRSRAQAAAHAATDPAFTRRVAAARLS
jgi:two-component system, NarL family, response regulator LiaR